MNRKLVIFGTGSFAEVADFLFTKDSDYEVVAFTADGKMIKESKFLNRPVVPFEDVLQEFPPDSFHMFIAIGYRNMNKIRAEKYARAKQKGYTLATYISSKATYWGQSIGDNCFIFEDNTIQPFVKIGNNVVMWSGNHIGHHSIIGDHCFISSHVVISGHVKVGPYCFIGVNTATRENITIGESCLIGAGALVMKGTSDREVLIAKGTMPDPRKSDELDF